MSGHVRRPLSLSALCGGVLCGGVLYGFVVIGATGSRVKAAEETGIATKGTHGLAPIVFHVNNATRASILCASTTAHWYSVDIGKAEPGFAVASTLWSQPETGTVFFVNQQGDRMPIQALWCGFAGRDRSTRRDIRLARRVGAAEAPVAITCNEVAPSGSLVCVPDVQR